MSQTVAHVGDLITHLGLLAPLRATLRGEVGATMAEELLPRLLQLPLLKSRAVTRLGSYRWRGTEPLSIRLQFAQEPAQLRETLLHEIAHFLDHQTRPERKRYSNPHGASWRRWLRLIGGADDGVMAASPALGELYRARLKPVARCRRCGLVIERQRRLPRGRRWLHRGCGGILATIEG